MSLEDSFDHVICILSIKINEIDTPATEAIIKAHVYESKGMINVKCSFLSGGAPDLKCISYDPTGPIKSFLR